MNKTRPLIKLVLIGAFLAVAAPALAFETYQGRNIIVPQDRVVTGSVFAAGNTVTIDGEVLGDVYCAGQNVSITGTVRGDVICASQNLQILGSVDGNVRSAGETIEIAGIVRKNLTVAGQTVHLLSNGEVDGEVVAAAQTFTADGAIGSAVMAAGQNLVFNTRVGGSLSLRGQNITLGSRAAIAGDLRYLSTRTAQLTQGSQISGQTIHTTPKPAKGRPEPVARLLALLYMVAAYYLIGVVAWWLARGLLTGTTKLAAANPIGSIGRGFILALLAPLVLVLVAITVIGLPLAVLGGIVWLLILAISPLIVAATVGVWANRYLPGKPHQLRTLLVGVIILGILFALPFIGWLFKLVAVFWGAGSIWLYYFESKKTR